MMILGMNMLIGGLIVTIIAAGQLIIFPFVIQQPLNQSSVVGLVLTLSGFFILLAGFVLVMHYDRKRSWHLGEIDKSTTIKNPRIAIKSTSRILEELTEEKNGD